MHYGHAIATAMRGSARGEARRMGGAFVSRKACKLWSVRRRTPEQQRTRKQPERHNNTFRPVPAARHTTQRRAVVRGTHTLHSFDTFWLRAFAAPPNRGRARCGSRPHAGTAGALGLLGVCALRLRAPARRRTHTHLVTPLLSPLAGHRSPGARRRGAAPRAAWQHTSSGALDLLACASRRACGRGRTRARRLGDVASERGACAPLSRVPRRSLRRPH